jgi:hypothetical protein
LISMVPWYILQVLFIASADLTNCFLTLVMQAHLPQCHFTFTVL